MWPFTRKRKNQLDDDPILAAGFLMGLRRVFLPTRPGDWWKPEYAELSSYNGLQMRASGNQYRIDASAEEREQAQRIAQEELDALSPEYVERMAAIQADYNETYRRFHGGRA